MTALAGDVAEPWDQLPRSHARPDVLVRKRQLLGAPHVAPLGTHARELERIVGLPVPTVDPASGGVGSRVLLLLETPSRAGTYGSGLISIDNDDTAAANLWRAAQQTGLPRADLVVWNAVPWYVGDEARIRPARPGEVTRATPYLAGFLELLPRLQVLIALGRAAQRAVLPLGAELTRRQVLLLAAPHPSQRVYNAPRQLARQRVHAAFDQAAAALLSSRDPR